MNPCSSSSSRNLSERNGSTTPARENVNIQLVNIGPGHPPSKGGEISSSKILATCSLFKNKVSPNKLTAIEAFVIPVIQNFQCKVVPDSLCNVFLIEAVDKDLVFGVIFKKCPLVINCRFI